MAKFMSMKDIIGKKGGDDDDDRKGGKKPKEDYVGGGASGLNVVNPVDRIFAKESESADGVQQAAVITFYKNGFTVDDGELRDPEAPENKAFLEAMDRGEIPAELVPRLRERAKATGEPLAAGVSVTDKRGEMYVPPPYRAFSGAGATLGGGAAAAPPAGAVVRAGGAGAAAAAATAAAVVVDESKPLANMQIRLLDGRREKVTLNLTHTVGDLMNKVASLGGTSKPFLLTAGFPPKPLSDPTATLEAAGLKNAQVTQKEA